MKFETTRHGLIDAAFSVDLLDRGLEMDVLWWKLAFLTKKFDV